MDLEYTVHRANDATVNKPATVAGEVVSATIPSFEVELVGNGTLTLRFFKTSDIAEAKAKFVAGKVFELDFTELK